MQFDDGFAYCTEIITYFYLYVLALWSLVTLCDGLDWLCRGCGKNQPQQGGEEQGLAKIARVFDPFKFSDHKECSICLGEFEESELVTVLPCDVRHYFHTHCI